jgi:hypothetical protein
MHPNPHADVSLSMTTRNTVQTRRHMRMQDAGKWPNTHASANALSISFDFCSIVKIKTSPYYKCLCVLVLHTTFLIPEKNYSKSLEVQSLEVHPLCNQYSVQPGTHSLFAVRIVETVDLQSVVGPLKTQNKKAGNLK